MRELQADPARRMNGDRPVDYQSAAADARAAALDAGKRTAAHDPDLLSSRTNAWEDQPVLGEYVALHLLDPGPVPLDPAFRRWLEARQCRAARA